MGQMEFLVKTRSEAIYYLVARSHVLNNNYYVTEAYQLTRGNETEVPEKTVLVSLITKKKLPHNDRYVYYNDIEVGCHFVFSNGTTTSEVVGIYLPDKSMRKSNEALIITEKGGIYNLTYDKNSLMRTILLMREKIPRLMARQLYQGNDEAMPYFAVQQLSYDNSLNYNNTTGSPFTAEPKDITVGVKLKASVVIDNSVTPPIREDKETSRVIHVYVKR